MNWIYKIRRAIPEKYIMYAIYVVLIAIFFTLIPIAAEVKADSSIPRMEDSPYTIENSEYNLNNSPHSIRNSEYNLNNSRYSGGSNKIRDNDGEVIGYSVERDDGGVNYFGYDGEGRIGYSPAPH